MRTNLPAALDAAIERHLSQIHTAMPGRIEKYDWELQKASVKPLIKKQYMDGREASLPLIVNVPVMFMRTDNFSFTYPINEGDLVLVLFTERSMELYLKDGGEQLPGDRRKFDLSDGIAIPGLYPFSEQSKATNNDDVLIKFKEATLRITGEGVFEMKGDLIVDGDVIADGISLKSHVHTGVASGDDLSGPPADI